MPSTYTTNNGIEKIATGEQSGTWGDTTNVNFDLLDEALDGQVSVALTGTGTSGSPNDLEITDGTSSNGRNRFVEFTGTPGGDTYVRLTPNDAEKVLFIQNSTNQTLLLFQGTYASAREYQLEAGRNAIVRFTGTGTTSYAYNALEDLKVSTLETDILSVSDDSTGEVSITSTSVPTLLKIQSNEDGADGGPRIDLYRNSSTPADDDRIAQIYFSGEDDGGGKHQYAKIEAFIEDATAGSEGGRLNFNVFSGGAGAAMLVLRSDTGGALGEVVVNEPGADINFRIEGSTDAKLFVTDAANDAVVIGHDTAQGIGGATPVPLQVAGTTGATSSMGIVRHQNTSSGPSIRFARSRTSTVGDVTIVQDDDQLGSINFYGADGTDLASIGAQIVARVDGTPGVDDMPGSLEFWTTADGANTGTERMRIDSSGNVGIGGDPSTSRLRVFGATPYFDIQDTTSGTWDQNDVFSGIRFRTSDPDVGGAGQVHAYLKAVHTRSGTGHTNPDAGLVFGTSNGTTPTAIDRMRITNDGYVGINETDPEGLLHITSSTTSNPAMFHLECTNANASTGPDVYLNRNSSSPADDDYIGAIHFAGNNSAGERLVYATHYGRIIDVTDGTEDGQQEFYILKAGSLRHVFSLRPDEVVVNQDGQDINFRVESDAGPHTFFVDAGEEFVGFSASTPAALNGYGERVRIASNADNLGGSLVMSANNGGRTSNSAENDIVFYDQDTAVTNNQNCGSLRWYGLDASGPGAGMKAGIRGRAQADGRLYFEFFSASTSGNYVKSATLASTVFQAGSDNTQNLGASGTRWVNVYATNGTIQTSDERLKQQVASLTADEINAAKAISALFKTYKWNDKVAAEGDNARIHSGVVAQQVKSAMEANNLDPMKYAFMCWNEYYEIEVSGEDIATPYMETFEVGDPDIPEGATYVDRYSIRYGELMSFIHAATEQRLASIESRLDALESA